MVDNARQPVDRFIKHRENLDKVCLGCLRSFASKKKQLRRIPTEGPFAATLSLWGHWDPKQLIYPTRTCTGCLRHPPLPRQLAETYRNFIPYDATVTDAATATDAAIATATDAATTTDAATATDAAACH